MAHPSRTVTPLPLAAALVVGSCILVDCVSSAVDILALQAAQRGLGLGMETE
ncbi:MAG: hypothetical protein P8R42_30005 [Candidatus Binatia bacterium]|nr:hypothetical protein [Candidatus Binatia bacterium]